MEPPKKIYVVMNSYGAPIFAHELFERAAERVIAILRGQMTELGAYIQGYFIVCVEGE